MISSGTGHSLLYQYDADTTECENPLLLLGWVEAFMPGEADDFHRRGVETTLS